MTPDLRPASAALVFTIDEAVAGERLDVALSSLCRRSRSQVSRWIAEGRVTVDGTPSRPARRVALGERVHAEPPARIRMRAEPQDIPLSILHEDADLVVVDKPAGLVVHPAPGHPDGTLVNALLHHCGDLAGVGGVLRPGIVHRLDQGTSGVMVVAKHDGAHRHLAAQFHDHTIERVYHALVRAVPGPERAEGRIEGAIGRHPRDRKRMTIRAEGGRPAVTRWRAARRFPRAGRAWLEVRPETGRTHQIRVHLAAHGMPLEGDPVYGRGRDRSPRSELGRPALHASVLGFEHPASGERLRFEAPLPPDLARLLTALGDGEGREGGDG